MHSFVNIESFEALIPKYDTYFFDLWGIVYDGNDIFPEFTFVLSKLRQHDKTIRFLSNSPRRSVVSQSRLAKCGLDIDLEEILTSGEYFAHLTANQEYKGKRFFLIGDDDTVIEGFDIEMTDSLSDADYVLIALCAQTQDLGQWQDVMKDSIERGIQALCLNPDIEVFQGQTKLYTPGYYSKHYEKFGGEVIYFGKPHKPVYDFLLSKLNVTGGVLALGDSIGTDIKGAHNAKIDSILVLGRGIHQDIKVTDKMKLLSLCQQHKCYPTYIMDRLKLNRNS